MQFMSAVFQGRGLESLESLIERIVLTKPLALHTYLLKDFSRSMVILAVEKEIFTIQSLKYSAI